MPAPFERPSIAIVLGQLADKTPPGEPLLVTRAEMGAYRQWLKNRAIQMPRADDVSPEFGRTSEPAFAGRPLRVIDEAKVLGPGMQAMRAALDIAEDYQRELEMRLRADGQVGGLFAGEDAKEFSAQSVELVDALRLNVAGAVRQAKAAPNIAGAMFVGENAKFAGESGPVIQQRKQQAEANIAETVRYRSSGGQDRPAFDLGMLIDSISARAPADAKASAEAFRSFVLKELELEREAPRTGTYAGIERSTSPAFARAGAPVTPEPARSTERNIPVGIPRGYFEE